MISGIDNKIHALITDPLFLELTSMQRRPNLFETLAASYTETWHSAFVKWLVDPNSHLGLGTYPLKLFLFTVIHSEKIFDASSRPTLTIGDIEKMDLSNFVFDTEVTDLRRGLSGRIDIQGISEEIAVKNSSDTISMRIIVENKVKARESYDQTVGYYNYALSTLSNYTHNLFVFLTLDKAKQPSSNKFIQITYQDVCDYIIKPCERHPEISNEARYLLQQYLLNLSKPVGGRPMALPNKDICKKIYEAHKEVLDEIFLSVKDETPQSTLARTRTSYGNITLSDLVGSLLLNISDTLHAKNGATATLRADSGKILIEYNARPYDNVSPAAKAVTGSDENGWKFWTVKSPDGHIKGTLFDLRQVFVDSKMSTAANDDALSI